MLNGRKYQIFRLIMVQNLWGGGIFVSLFQDLTAKRKEREEFKKDLVTQLQHTNYESLRLVCDARNIPGVFYE